MFTIPNYLLIFSFLYLPYFLFFVYHLIVLNVLIIHNCVRDLQIVQDLHVFCVYENSLNRSSVAFCLYFAAELQGSNLMTEEGCWHDHETNGIQCLCQKDFCNSPRNLWTSDPTKPPIEGLKMLKRNPFVDYEYLEEESSAGKKSSSSSSSESINSIISSLDASENEDERDLVPINFEDYMNWLENNSVKTTPNPNTTENNSIQNVQFSSAIINGINNYLFYLIYFLFLFLII
uniref:Uncharacterized protein n=1 Tax=Meloidogyne enterolobii TaxID=390850 RepID=A0A6V7UD43_MELEN|nr:unnamed protein product [Meloidogyne enterolobii]